MNYRRPIIETRGLTMQFGPRKALDNVSLSVREGAIFGLVGPNGSGKTTLTRALCGLRPPTGGSGTVIGYDVVRDAQAIREHVGYMSQKFSLYDDLTSKENIDFFATMHGLIGPDRKQRIDEVVDLLGLRPYMKSFAGSLSGGWKQRLALATTIIHRPALMFLDEPTAGIDPVARRDLWDELVNLAAAGSTIFVTTQYMDELERCTDVAYIYLSRLIVSGTPNELKRQVTHVEAGLRYIDIESPDAILAIGWLRQQRFCKSATVYGANIHALVRSNYSDADIEARFPESGARSAKVRTIEPTLEDVFVVLTERAVEAAKMEKVMAGRATLTPPPPVPTRPAPTKRAG